MARFDVYELKAAAGVPLVVDVQADLLEDLRTRVVVPLLPLADAEQEVAGRLKPIVDIAGAPYVLLTTDLGVAPTAALGGIELHPSNSSDRPWSTPLISFSKDSSGMSTTFDSLSVWSNSPASSSSYVAFRGLPGGKFMVWTFHYWYDDAERSPLVDREKPAYPFPGSYRACGGNQMTWSRHQGTMSSLIWAAKRRARTWSDDAV